MTDEVLVEIRALRAEVASLRTLVVDPRAPVLSVTQVAARLHCSKRQVFRLLKDGSLERAKRRIGREAGVTLTSVASYENPSPTALPARPASNSIPVPFDIEAELAAVAEASRGRNGDVVEDTARRALSRSRRSKLS